MNANIKFDHEHLWHPYTSLPAAYESLLVESAKGSLLRLSDGRELIDGISSWWSVIHGYNHPVLNQAIIEQTEKMAHVMFGGLTHEPAIKLGQTLLKILPASLDQIFFCDSGSISVEVAMKIAIQYWNKLNKSEKKKFVTFRGGYHGDTLHAMSVGDPEGGMHSLFKSCLPEQYFISSPKKEFDVGIIKELEEVFLNHSNEIAAFICEPLMQGAEGMRFYDIEYLVQIKNLCKKHNVLLIFDEIATGFGRTGRLFVSNEIEPDILCIGKGLTGGYMTLAATITTKQISSNVGTLMHGPTFMANPLACAVANASVNLLINSNWKERISRIEKILTSKLMDLKSLPQIQDVRVMGAIGAIEFKENPDLNKIRAKVIEKGVWLRPFKNILYTMPPYVINDYELEQVCDAMNYACR